MAKKQIQKNIEKNNKAQEAKIQNKKETKALIIVLVSVVLVLLCVYLVTAFVRGDFASKSDDDSENTIKLIASSEVFNKSNEDYFVIFYDLDDEDSDKETLETKINDLSSLKKIYKVDLGDKINSAIQGNVSNTNAQQTSDLSINGVTLMKISENKNVEYVEGYTAVNNYLETISQ